MLSSAVAPSLATPATAGQASDAASLSVPGTPEFPTDYRTGTLQEERPGGNDSHVRTTNVTLVTGQTVTVVHRSDRTSYHVEADGPVYEVDTPRGTYVFPAGVDLSTFDPALFNVDLLLEQRLNDTETDSVPVIVQLNDGDSGPSVSTDDSDRTRSGGDGERSPRSAREELNETEGLTADQTLESANAVAGHVEKARGKTVAETLQANPDVEKVYLDAKVKVTLDDVGNVTNARQAREEYGVDGSGVTVAVVDTGVDDTHPDLQGRVVAAKDFTGENTTEDLHGHGTHVAGIVAGDGSASNGTHVGVAPNASVMNVRVLDEYGMGYRSDIIDGIEWARKNGADVISMSLGGPVYADDPYRAAIRNATEAGVNVVVAAGNDGYYGYGTVGSPGVVPEAITVGASDDADDVAYFSSRGPTPIHQYVKPNLVAPGVDIVSAQAGTDGYVAYSGTSMATPAVSGAAALLLEANPGWTPTQVRSALVTTTDSLNQSYDVYTRGSGRLNASAALGSELTIANSTVDFGVIVNATEKTRVVSVTNRGDAPKTLNVSAAAVNVEDGTAGNATTNVSELTVPAGGTSHVALTVNTTGDAGVYSGTLSFDDGNYSAIFGYVRASELTVEKRSGDGGDVSEDVLYVLSEETGHLVVWDVFGSDGTVSRIVSGGNYTIFSAGLDENTGNETVFTVNTTSVVGSTTVVLDESETVRYGLDTSAVAAEHGPLANLTAISQVHDVVAGYNVSLTAEWEFAETRSARFSTGSWFNASVSHLLAPEAYYDATPDDHLDSPVAYTLTYPTKGVDGPRTFEINHSYLAAANYTYYRNYPGETYDVNPFVRHDRWGEYKWFYGPVPYTDHWLGSWSLRDRTEQTIYRTPRTGTYNRSYVLDIYGDGFWGWLLYQPEWTAPAAGDTSNVSVNEHPYTGQRTNWTLDPGAATNFSVEAWFMAEQPPSRHVYDDYSWNEYAVYRNDTLVYHDVPWWDWFDAEYENDSALAPNTTYQIQMWGDNGGGALSTTVYTSYYGEYQPGTDNVPPRVVSIDAPERTINNAIPEGNATVTVQVGDDANLSNVSLQVAFAPGWVDLAPYDGDYATLNDGWSWGNVTEDSPGNFSATLDTSGLSGETIHLAVTATDGDGNLVDLNTYRAFNVIDLAPPDVNVSASPADHVSVRNPATVTVTSTDANPGTTVVNVTNASGGLLAQYDVTDAVADGPTTIEWNATNATGAPLASGTYNVTLRSVDALGNENETTATLSVDHAEPTVAVVALDGNETARTAPAGRTVYTNGTVSVNATADGTPGDAAGVAVRFDAAFTNFRSERFPASRAGGTNWSRTANLSNLTDDGAYRVNVTAVDPGLNRNATTANATVVLDRDAPDLGATITREDATTGRVNVTASERLATNPAISVTLPNGTAISPNVTSSGATWWNGTFPLNDTGSRYNVTAAGVDLAGNRGQGTANTTIETVNTTNNHVTVLFESSGLFVNFTTQNEVNNTFVTITRSDTPLAPLTNGNAGVSFLNAKLGDLLDQELRYAIIGIPVTDDLPGSVENPDAVTIRYYNESATGQEKWETVETTVENRTLNGTERTYWIANVSHFSTYGAVASDTAAPTLDSATPSGDLAAGTTTREVRFEYSDGLSGINASAVTLTFDGEDVTADAATTITSQYATYNATGLTSGSYTATVTVVDEAGNDETYETTFTVGGSGSGAAGGGGGGAPPPPSLLKEVTPLADGGVEMTIQNGLKGRTAQEYFDGIQAGDVTFDRLRISFAYTLDEFTFALHPRADAPSDVDAFEGPALGYLAVDREVQNGYFESVALRFEVSKSALPEDASLDDVALYRYDGGSWETVETSRSGTTYTATADGFATFAVGVSVADEGTPTPTPTPTTDETTTARDESTAAPTATPEDGQPGFGFVVGLLALVVLVGAVRRRS